MNLLLTKNYELFMWSLSQKFQLQKSTIEYLPKTVRIESISTDKISQS